MTDRDSLGGCSITRSEGQTSSPGQSNQPHCPSSGLCKLARGRIEPGYDQRLILIIHFERFDIDSFQGIRIRLQSFTMEAPLRRSSLHRHAVIDCRVPAVRSQAPYARRSVRSQTPYARRSARATEMGGGDEDVDKAERTAHHLVAAWDEIGFRSDSPMRWYQLQRTGTERETVTSFSPWAGGKECD